MSKLSAAALIDPRTGFERWVFVSADPSAFAARARQRSWVEKKSPKAARTWLLELLELKPEPIAPEMRELGNSTKKTRQQLLDHWVARLVAQGAPLLNVQPEEEAIRAVGRPTLFSWDLAAKLLDRIAAGESLRRIVQDEDMPGRSTVMKWAVDNEEFRDHYALAREFYADSVADECLDIADDGTNDWYDKQTDSGSIRVVDHEHIQRSRTRIDTRKWHLAQMNKRYHPRQVHQHEGNADAPIPIVPELPPLPDGLAGQLGKHIRLALQGQSDDG